MLNIITVFKSGGDYSREYVINLRRGVAQHLTLEHRFICLTDTVKEAVFDEDTQIQWEPLRHDWPGWWSKVEMFRPDLERYGRFLYLDLSCVVVGELDDIASYDGPACTTSDWYYGGPSPSILSFAPKEMRAVWDLFNSGPEHWMKQGDKHIAPDFGDQILVNKVYGKDGLKRWQNELPGQIVSFKVHCKVGIPNGARLVKFHGQPRIHDCEEPWVNAAWKTGVHRSDGPTGCNTPTETLLGQIKQNSERDDLEWLLPAQRRLKPVCIVGGAPSLIGNIDTLRRRKRRGQLIWAANGAHDFLIKNKIIPDVCVIMDAQEHNIEFLRHPHPRVEYLIASRCHPSLFDALEGYNVKLWHTYDEGIEDYLRREHVGRPWAVFMGGGTVCLRSMSLYDGMGGKSIHLFGVDSSYAGDANHAYKQPQNSGEETHDMFIGEKKFQGAQWMAHQVEQFMQQYGVLAKNGVKIKVHGDGMLPYAASLMEQGDE